jgi:lipopolysaccharide export system permease protein
MAKSQAKAVGPPGVQIMKILDRYIVVKFLRWLFPVLLLLLALLSCVALADELEKVGKGTFSQIDAFLVLLYTSPRRIVDLMPVSALLGGLMGLGAMANHHELIAARAAGMSKARMARPVFEAVLLAAALVIFMQALLIPVSERAASELRSKALEETSLGVGGKLEFWTRSGENFVHVSDVLFNRILENIEIYNTDSNGKLRQLIQARRGTIVGSDTWLLEEVVRTRLDGLTATEDRRTSMEWQGLLSEEQANILILPLEALAPLDLVRYITHLQANDLDTHHFRVIFWQQVSVVITVLAMGLLSLPLLVGSTRAISASQRIIMGGIIGIVFYLLQQVTGHFAELFNLIPSVTILTPVLLLLAIAVMAQYWRGIRVWPGGGG